MKTIIITGGTGLLGKILAIYLLKKGNIIIISSRFTNKKKFITENNLEEFKENLNVFKLDYLKKNSVEDFVDKLRINNIIPDVLIHNARSLDSLKIEDNGESSSQNILEEYKIGVVGPYKLNNSILKSNVGSKLKNIIFISSIYGVVAPTPSLYDNFEHQSPIQYGVTKASQIHLSKELAVRLSNKGIRVNTISLGGIKGRTNKSFIDKYSKFNPQHKMLSADDVIKPIEFLIKDDSKSMTGHNLIVDSGWTIW